MTKKIIAILLVLVTLMSITACSDKTNNEQTNNSATESTTSQTPSDTTPPTTNNGEEDETKPPVNEMTPSYLYTPIRLSKNDSVDSIITFGYGAKEMVFSTGSIYFLTQDTGDKTVKEFQIQEGSALIRNKYGRAELADIKKENILIPTDFGTFKYPASKSLSHIYNPTNNYLYVFNDESDTLSIYTQNKLTGEQETVVENKKIQILTNNEEKTYEKIDKEKAHTYTDISDIYINEKESVIAITKDGTVINMGIVSATFFIIPSDNDSIILSSPAGAEIASLVTEYKIDNNGGLLYCGESYDLYFYYANDEKTYLVNSPMGHTISDIAEMYAVNSEKILARMTNGDVYRFTKQMGTGYICVGDNELTDMYKGGHIIEFAVFANDFIFLGADHVVYETIKK